MRKAGCAAGSAGGSGVKNRESGVRNQESRANCSVAVVNAFKLGVIPRTFSPRISLAAYAVQKQRRGRDPAPSSWFARPKKSSSLGLRIIRSEAAFGRSPNTSQIPATSYQLPATSYQLPTTSYWLPATNYRLSATKQACLSHHGTRTRPVRG